MSDDRNLLTRLLFPRPRRRPSPGRKPWDEMPDEPGQSWDEKPDEPGRSWDETPPR
jgi:hypothetical protein